MWGIGWSRCACAISRFEGTFVAIRVSLCTGRTGPAPTAGGNRSMGDRGCGRLGHERVSVEARELERLDQPRRLLRRDELGERRADDRRRLEAVRAPAAVDDEALDLRHPHHGAEV